MEETGKKRLVGALAVAAGIAYFLVCAHPLPKELVLAPSWSRLLSSAPIVPAAGTSAAGTSAAGTSAMPFQLGGKYGYFSADGKLIFAATPAYGVAMAPDAYAAYERLSEGFAIKSPFGSELARVKALGYPFFAASRRFVIGPDQAAVSELSADGRVAWSRRFGSVVTAFAASPSLAVFGLMDGTMVGMDRSGSEVLSFAPGGSRIPGIYGVAVSPDGQIVAAISGLDKQRFVVMEKRVSAYRVAYHRWLDSDYRRPVTMAFTSDGRRLVFESPVGVGVYERGGAGAGRESFLPIAAPSGLGLSARGGELLVFLSGLGADKRLVCASLPDRLVVDAPLSAKDAFVLTSGDSIFIGADDRIARLDLREM
jgi:hypothetical protein